VKEQLIDVKAYLESRRMDNNIGYFLKVFTEKLDTKALYSVIPCYYGWLAVMIDVGGQVYPCCRCYEPLGNVYDNKFYEIWNGETYRRFREEAVGINIRKTAVRGCDCYNCVHHTANLRVYKALHPVKGRSRYLQGLSPCGMSADE
jgi:radical SAM protein with 4Fe4S-binding SPASM domain